MSSPLNAWSGFHFALLSMCADRAVREVGPSRRSEWDTVPFTTTYLYVYTLTPWPIYRLTPLPTVGGTRKHNDTKIRSARLI